MVPMTDIVTRRAEIEKLTAPVVRPDDTTVMVAVPAVAIKVAGTLADS
jgi:hypothetical protein